MKRTFVKITVFAVTFGMVLASCNNEAENAKLQEADDLAVQGLVDAKLASLDSSVQAEWNAKVVAAADSVLAEAKKKGAHHAAAKPVAKPVAKKEEPKAGTLGAGKAGVVVQETQLGAAKVGTTINNAQTQLGKGKAGVQQK